MPAAKIRTEQDILRAMAVTKSNIAAAKYLNVSFWTYRKYAKLYIDKETGKTLWEKHKNQSGKGVPKFYNNKGKGGDLQMILKGEITTIDNYDIEKFKTALIRDLIFFERCNRCGFDEARVLDYKVPLLINFKDGNRKNWRQPNLELICYNCYYLTVGDVFTKRQIQDIESHVDTSKTNEVTWDLDPYMKEHLKDLGLMDDEDKGDEDNDFIAYKDYVK